MFLVLGKNGQLSQEMKATKSNRNVIFLGRNEVDLLDIKSLYEKVDKFKIKTIINTAAFTDVDRAERHKQEAYDLNEIAVRNIANCCKDMNIRLIHISTDYVFDGRKEKPYLVSDSPNPINVYGKSKLAGEIAIKEMLIDNFSIIRTSWLYSTYGNNFLKNIIGLLKTRKQLNIVGDQVSSPTYAKPLSKFIWNLAEQRDILPLYHYSDDGEVSWFDFATHIYQLNKEHGNLKTNVHIKRISSKEYKQSASRPKYSVLDCGNLKKKPWLKNLRDCMSLL